MSNGVELRVGDWVRVMRAGRLVTACVEYVVQRASWDSTLVAITDTAGSVAFDEVYEVRRVKDRLDD